MQFIKDYFSEDSLRRELNELTMRTFCFDFEKWFQSGGYEGEYIPFSFEEDGRILSNASANIMRFVYDGAEKRYIQIGTVMTAEDCRNKGYARELVTKIVAEYEGKADGIYLFSNLSALGFYDKMGFQRGLQYRYYLKKDVMVFKTGSPFEKTEYMSAALRNYYVSTIRKGVINAKFEQINRYGLMMFYTENMEQVYYSKELDCFICFEIEDDVLHLNSVISRYHVSLRKVLERMPVDYEKLVLGFTPCSEDSGLFSAKQYDGEDDYRFFYRGEDLNLIERNKLFFPEFSHA